MALKAFRCGGGCAYLSGARGPWGGFVPVPTSLSNHLEDCWLCLVYILLCAPGLAFNLDSKFEVNLGKFDNLINNVVAVFNIINLD